MGLKEGHHMQQCIKGHEQEGTHPKAPVFDELCNGHVAHHSCHLTSHNSSAFISEQEIERRRKTREEAMKAHLGGIAVLANQLCVGL
jgi:hypothetical protein